MKEPPPIAPVKPMEVCVRGLRGGTTAVCIEGPKFEHDAVKRVDRRTQAARYFDIPGAPYILRLTAENVKSNGFASVPEALVFLTKNYMGPRGDPLYLFSVAQGKASVPAEFMDLGTLRIEIEDRTRVRPSKDLSREGAVKVLRALRGICAEDIEAPAEPPKAIGVAVSSVAAPSGVLDDLMNGMKE